MKITVRDALKCIAKGDGQPFSFEQREKIINFIRKLPHNPKNYFEILRGHSDGDILRYTVMDYNEGWFATITIGDDRKTFNIHIDGDNLDRNNPNRVKSNDEAMKLIEEFHAIKFYSDYDQYWQMSDDPRTYRAGSEHDNKAYGKQNEICSKLW